MFIKIAINSLINRRVTAWLTILSVATSLFVLLAVKQITSQAKTSFGRTVSGVDLIVGARTGQLNLLLASVFRIGYVSNSVSWPSYQAIKHQKHVSWAIPISLGDSHKGYPVLGTTTQYFDVFKYGNKQSLKMAQGQAFVADAFDSAQVVLGAGIAEKLGYTLGQELILSHGVGVTSFSHHDHVKFTVSGILEFTGTPIDQTLHISLSGLEVMHDKEHAIESGDTHLEHEHHAHEDVEKVSAVLVGVKAKFATLFMQKFVNEYKQEPLMAIIPGVALTELWQMMASMEKVLLLISVLVLLATLLGMSTMLLASMRERSREISILRALGASPWFVFCLIELEVLVLTLISLLLALVMVWGVSIVAAPILSAHYGIFIDVKFWGDDVYSIVASVLVVSLIMGLLPAINAYKNALQTGLLVK
ncbi:MAG: putative ABC transport system permease protein [Psychrosphaera sp.]|jgi:putative ABC transport system permease protein